MGLLEVYYCITQFNVYLNTNYVTFHLEQRKTWRMAIATLINEWKKEEEEGHVLLLLEPRACQVSFTLIVLVNY